MQTTTVLNFGLPATEASQDDLSLNEVLCGMPELPSLGQRWTVRRKAAENAPHEVAGSYAEDMGLDGPDGK